MSPRRSPTLDDVLAEHRRAHPARVAVVDGDLRLTYAQLAARVDRLAGALAARGFGPGDRLLWLGQNSFRILELLLAAGALGGMVCAANWRQSAEELAFVIEDFDPALVIWQAGEIGAAVQAAREAAGARALWLRHDDDTAGGYEAFVAGGRPLPAPPRGDAGAPVLVIYTAAFGGRPNGAMLDHAALLAQAQIMARVEEIDTGYVYLNCGPLFHIATWMRAIPAFLYGGTNVYTRRVEAEALCRVIERERCNGGFILTPTIRDIVALNADRRHDLSSLRAMQFGDPAVDEAWSAMTHPQRTPWTRNSQGYGQTELTGQVTLCCIGGPAQGTHGWTVPGAQVRILDPDGAEVADGEAGEICVRGPMVTHGYWNRPALNAARTRGGWWHTTDLGRREPDGSLSFIGTQARMIKSGNENIYPAEVEACIESHPAVAEAAIIGVPDDRWVQSVKAIVVLKPGARAAAEEIVEHCRARMASYKKPRTVEFAAAPLPRAGFVKDHAALDARYGGGNYPGGSTRGG
ncbi:MAG: AMP-binding protein [Gammaproteobacteria bacterium]